MYDLIEFLINVNWSAITFVGFMNKTTIIFFGIGVFWTTFILLPTYMKGWSRFINAFVPVTYLTVMGYLCYHLN
jgi:hypothetical protein